MDRRERVGDPEELLRITQDAAQARLWTALPGIVQAFDPDRMVASVQPAISAIARNPDGTLAAINLPLLLDCPVQFPGGGGVTLTFPLAAGDEVLVVFASRCIDSWWQLGGIQGQAELRMHDLSDGFVIPAVRSQPRKFSVSTGAAQLRTDDGSAVIELNPGTKAVNVTTSGAVTASAGGNITATAGGTASVTASTEIDLTAPVIKLNGNVIAAGTFSQTGGGSSTMSGSLSVTGSLTASVDVVGGGKSLKTHTHSGVTSGSGSSGPPN